MSLKEFSARNLRRCISPEGFNHPLSGWSLADWMLAAAGELGEAMNVAKKLNRERDGITGNDKSKGELLSDLSDELADTVIYLDLVAHAEGIDLSAYLEESCRVWGRVDGDDVGKELSLSEELLAILVSLGNAAAIANRLVECRSRAQPVAGLHAVFGGNLGDVTRRIFRLLSSRGYDPLLALDIKFRRTSAKIGYREIEVYPAGAAIQAEA